MTTKGSRMTDTPTGNSQEKRLIEEAAKAIRSAWAERYRAGGRGLPSDAAAHAALAVFEKAHTPTDDEREAAMDEAWGFRAETRPIQEKWNAQHWFDAGWRAALRAAWVCDDSSSVVALSCVSGDSCRPTDR